MDKTIPKDNTQNYPFCRLKLVVKTFGHSLNELANPKFIEVPKVVKLTNKKTLV